MALPVRMPDQLMQPPNPYLVQTRKVPDDVVLKKLSDAT